MNSSFGSHLQYTLFGESHSAAIGITIQGLPSGFTIDFSKINEKLALRRGGQQFNTARQEADTYELLSGYFNNQTTGTPLTVIFPNRDVRSSDYEKFTNQPRPGHADYVASVKYKGGNDPRGGGHFSGRMTTPLVFLGAIVLQLILAENPDFMIASHIKQLKDVKDIDYYTLRQAAVAQAFALTDAQTKLDAHYFVDTLENDDDFIAYTEALASIQHRFSQLDARFPVLDIQQKTAMEKVIAKTAEAASTLGGNIETVVFHPPVALGEPFFHSVESYISSLLFSIGSVKAVHFGYGDDFISASGTDVKDEIIQLTDNRISTLYNYNGGINGGISNGEDIVISTTFKPISSIQQTQHTFNTKTQKIEPLAVSGRHDVTIANRIIPVIEAMSVIAIYDLMLTNNVHHEKKNEK